MPSCANHRIESRARERQLSLAGTKGEVEAYKLEHTVTSVLQLCFTMFYYEAVVSLTLHGRRLAYSLKLGAGSTNSLPGG